MVADQVWRVRTSRAKWGLTGTDLVVLAEHAVWRELVNVDCFMCIGTVLACVQAGADCRLCEIHQRAVAPVCTGGC